MTPSRSIWGIRLCQRYSPQQIGPKRRYFVDVREYTPLNPRVERAFSRAVRIAKHYLLRVQKSWRPASLVKIRQRVLIPKLLQLKRDGDILNRLAFN